MRLITLHLINTAVFQGKCLSTSKCVEAKIGLLLHLTFKGDRVLKVRKQVPNLLLGWQGGVMLLNQMLLCKVKANIQVSVYVDSNVLRQGTHGENLVKALRFAMSAVGLGTSPFYWRNDSRLCN